jgi:methionine synthase II (cobalamin-independent)
MTEQNAITQKTLIEDLVQDFPEVIPTLVRHGVICIECGEPIWGTLGEAMERAGIKNRDDRQTLLAELQDMTRF